MDGKQGAQGADTLRQQCYKARVRKEMNVLVLQNKTVQGTQDDGLSPRYWELVTYKET